MSSAVAGRRRSDLDRLLGEMVAGGAVSAAVALVGSGQVVEAVAAAGPKRSGGRALADGGSLFDLASLTKPIMATLALRLDREGILPLRLPLGDIWPEADAALADKTLEDLLRHRAGFRPWTPLARRCRDAAGAARLLVAGSMSGSRSGTYSDLDFVLWGFAAERVTGRSLRELVAAHLGGELRPAPGAVAEVVQCLLDNRREVELAGAQGIRLARRGAPPLGKPQDGNARFLGGLAGHAGLFASAQGLWTLARQWLAVGGLLTAAQVETALSGRGRFALGWARRRVRGPAGPLLGRRAFGHTGFTGGSLWIDPEAEKVLILLAHRCRVGVALDPWRRRFHRLALTG